jgi:hypothetical protein
VGGLLGCQGCYLRQEACDVHEPGNCWYVMWVMYLGIFFVPYLLVTSIWWDPSGRSPGDKHWGIT